MIRQNLSDMRNLQLSIDILVNLYILSRNKFCLLNSREVPISLETLANIEVILEVVRLEEVRAELAITKIALASEIHVLARLIKPFFKFLLPSTESIDCLGILNYLARVFNEYHRFALSRLIILL